MNLQIFPNWGKKVGVLTFIIFSFLEGRDDAIRGFVEGATLKPYSLKENEIFSFEEYFGSHLILLFSILSLAGMLIYILSKEKVEDDYINKIRLESYQLSFLFAIFIALLFLVIGFKAFLEIRNVISILLAIYLIIFAIKKRTV